MSILRTHPVVAFAGGGTGGHLYPMLAIAQEMQSRDVPPRFMFFATERAIDKRLLERAFVGGATPVHVQPVRPLPGRVRDWPGFLRAWRASMAMCVEAMRRQIPDVVVGSGGYGSAPAICAARKLGIPTALLNPDAIPGKANRYLARKADVVFAQWRVTNRHFGRSVRVEVSGCPVRRAFSKVDRQAGLERFGLESDKRVLLVTGASQGAQSINRAVVTAMDDLTAVSGWQILHLTGSGDFEFVRDAYAGRGAPAKALDYTEYMADALAAADLVITRAGASTLAEITAVGRGSVIFPYPHHIDRHQYANAKALVESGAAVMLEDRIVPVHNAAAIASTVVPLMRDGAALETMSHAASKLGVADAASRVADAIYALSDRKPDGGRSSRNVLRQPRHWSENGGRDDDDGISPPPRGGVGHPPVDAAA